MAHFLDLFVNSRSARYEYHTHEKSVRFARRALSALLSWGKHRLSQEARLFRDVLLHRSIVTEVVVFLQWYLFITVITHRYELVLRLSKYSQTPRCPCIPGRRRPSVLDGPDHRGIRGKFSTRRFVPSFINFCTRTACTPHISSSAAASDSGGFAFFRARQIVLPSTSPDIERFPVRKTFGIRKREQ